MSGKPLTGRKVFAIFAAGFGVIIAVNVVLAVQAVGTFPGLEVKNSYVASQTFDDDRAAQEALGWDVSAEVTGGALRVAITGPDGRPVAPEDLSVRLGRTTMQEHDMTPELIFDGTAHVAPVDAGPGKWELRVNAVAADGTEFKQRLIVHVDDPVGDPA
ncbi:FixH family protein [Psychromarinibacter sp. C21-152]|uniref:FixH family protein n=1 Tax=Psychromarinibacter sediminicola TaxID=3033385 RepID=A0AAE3NSY2_9RHOB|nr:FixH family protein [Psychromarinibacter sediminicola]MDF0601064.1 FixH family protein [Psychromarinibacter sediminicola]